MTTHIVIRITADATIPKPQHAAYGPVTRAEGVELMKAGYSIFHDLNLQIMRNTEGDRMTAWRIGSPITWKLLLVELRPATEDVCEGIV